MLSFQDFLLTHPTCKVVANSTVAQHIYEQIIWNDLIRIKMVELSDTEIAALAACGKQIEAYCTSYPHNDLDLKNNTVKQVIGRMVATALEPLGYTPIKKKRLPLGLGLTEFKNATVFAYTGNETQRIEKRIVDIIN